MRFNIHMDNKTIHEAAALVEKHFKDTQFLLNISSEVFFNTKDSGHIVASKINQSDLTMNIVPYKTKLPWSKAIGYASGNTIYVNIRKLDLPLRDRCNNFIHELCHLLGYSHKGNYVTEYNLNTVPYKIGSLFEEYLESIGKL